MKPSNQITGNVGMYYTCFKLSQLGLNVMPTSRNAKGPDVVAYTADGCRFFTFQVKAMSKLANINLGASLESVRSSWWVVIFGVNKEAQSLILTPDEVKASCRMYKEKYWAQGCELANNQNALNNWNRIFANEFLSLSYTCV